MFLVRSISRFSSVESAPGGGRGSGATPVGMLMETLVERTVASFDGLDGKAPRKRR